MILNLTLHTNWFAYSTVYRYTNMNCLQYTAVKLKIMCTL